MVDPQFSKLFTGVRFSHSAPKIMHRNSQGGEDDCKSSPLNGTVSSILARCTKTLGVSYNGNIKDSKPFDVGPIPTIPAKFVSRLLKWIKITLQSMKRLFKKYACIAKW